MTTNFRDKCIKDRVKFGEMQILSLQKSRKLVSVAAINEKTGKRLNYNIIQLRQLEKELETLRQELSADQQKKAALIAQRSSIESELKSME
jgi:septal ring factor EnvC (AmiA/AmiB activator)